jgi:hypothetical protein
MLFVAGIVAALSAATEIPYFARQYGVACSYCHVTPPKLQATGEAFIARGYRLPGRDRRATWPVALWLSGRSEALPGVEAVRNYVNRVELISGGVIGPRVSYFVEWRALSLETRGDGSLRDRSGRFEDLFVVIAAERADLTLGQFRLIGQVDVSRRVGVAEPLLLSTSLRGFAPAGRSPAARVGLHVPLGPTGWRWTTTAALPLVGELSLPLTDEARREASNQLDWDAKGLVVETFARRGLHSVGAHAFYDHSGRYLAHAVATGHRGAVHWTAIAGVARAGPAARGRWSLEGEYLPPGALGGGARVEDLAGDGRDPAVILYLNAHAPGTRYTVRITAEHRIQRGRAATLIELGTVF